LNGSAIRLEAGYGATNPASPTIETGLLVEARNVAQFREALLQLMLNRETAKKFGAQGRARFQQYFSYEHFAERLREDLSPFVATTPQPTVSRA
jgi:glycosyltransferase involved in cell wall biosynthesis